MIIVNNLALLASFTCTSHAFGSHLWPIKSATTLSLKFSVAACNFLFCPLLIDSGTPIFSSLTISVFSGLIKSIWWTGENLNCWVAIQFWIILSRLHILVFYCFCPQLSSHCIRGIALSSDMLVSESVALYGVFETRSGIL